MKQYYRDKISGALIIHNPEKESEILFRRKMEEEIKYLREEINTLKSNLDELLAKRN